ncbi:dienelactone hydrolase family protein [Reyranella sp. CPCC 100927]|uniref:dienelactone hydrolase family protein n=1 Tax=Reyranella sp. CPCC 100927 TaxID=2599616 RepID=UPI0011B6A28A|nr:dienelactone hydrolase family protein [Reyranella sp. CPCC 100927]TWT13047.1 dienelactone hydrolase family protein [Reyranella sp. CPCC 100927]
MAGASNVVIESDVDIATADGVMNTYRVRPRQAVPYPAVVMLTDAAGVRTALRDIARRIAAAGYVVFVPNLYYRTSRDFVAGPLHNHPDVEKNTAEMTRHRTAIGYPDVSRDIGALLDHIDADRSVRPGKVGTVGYCMSGAYIVTTAASWPGRIACGASFYGTRLMADVPQAPWRRLGEIEAELYFAFAEFDSHVPLDQVAAFKAHLAQAPFKSTVDIVPGTGHGYAFADSVTYNKPAAEQHFQTVLALFRRHL